MRLKIFQFLCNHFRRFKFRQICKAIGIKPYWWQKNFALSRYPILYIEGGRRSGKTMAVILRALMFDGTPSDTLENIFRHDPDYIELLTRKNYYFKEYILSM